MPTRTRLADGSTRRKAGNISFNPDGAPCCCAACALACFPTPGEKVLVLKGQATGSAKDAALDSAEVDITSSFSLSYTVPTSFPAGGATGSQYRDVPWRDPLIYPQIIRLQTHSPAPIAMIEQPVTATLKAKFLSKTFAAAFSTSGKTDSDFYTAPRTPDADEFRVAISTSGSGTVLGTLSGPDNFATFPNIVSPTGFSGTTFALGYDRAATVIHYTVTGDNTGAPGRPAGGSVTGTASYSLAPGYLFSDTGLGTVSAYLTIPWETWSGSAWIAAADKSVPLQFSRRTIGVIAEYTDAEQDFPMSHDYTDPLGQYWNLRSADTWTETGVSILQITASTPPACELYWTNPDTAVDTIQIDTSPVDLNTYACSSSLVSRFNVEKTHEWSGSINFSVPVTYPGGEDLLTTKFSVLGVDYLVSGSVTFTIQSGPYAGRTKDATISFSASRDKLEWSSFQFVFFSGGLVFLTVAAGHVDISPGVASFVITVDAGGYPATTATITATRSLPNPVAVTATKSSSPMRWAITAVSGTGITGDYAYSVDESFDPLTADSSSLVTATLTIRDAPGGTVRGTADMSHSFSRYGAISPELIFGRSGFYEFKKQQRVINSGGTFCGAIMPPGDFLSAAPSLSSSVLVESSGAWSSWGGGSFAVSGVDIDTATFAWSATITLSSGGTDTVVNVSGDAEAGDCVFLTAYGDSLAVRVYLVACVSGECVAFSNKEINANYTPIDSIARIVALTGVSGYLGSSLSVLPALNPLPAVQAFTAAWLSESVDDYDCSPGIPWHMSTFLYSDPPPSSPIYGGYCSGSTAYLLGKVSQAEDLRVTPYEALAPSWDLAYTTMCPTPVVDDITLSFAEFTPSMPISGLEIPIRWRGIGETTNTISTVTFTKL